jgi:hypothetical protein
MDLYLQNERMQCFNKCYKNPFWNWSTVCIIDRDLLGPRTRGKVFNLSIVTG